MAKNLGFVTVSGNQGGNVLGFGSFNGLMVIRQATS